MEGGDQSLMATIDDKVVAMSFESSKFEQGVNSSISAINKLKAALKFDGAAQGLDNIDRAASGVQTGLLSKIGGAIDAILPKLDTLRLVAIGVMSQIATRAVTAGASLIKSLTLDPIIQGFHEYTTNLNAVQTIMANTQAAGTTLKDVNKALNTLNIYSDKTIYNFSQMARNIGTFTAAGVDLDTATGAIKGIANLAALSGSNADQASTAMYQLSQAISAGKVSLMDWNSVVNAGMGGTVFQRALAQTAEQMGTLKKGAVDLVGPMKNVSINGESFRSSLSATGGPGGSSWLTSKVLTNTLQQFTGDLSDAQLKAQGFNDAQIKAIQQTAKTAQEAATQVKTLGQLLDTTKESIGSGWAQTWQIIFGDFKEAKGLFTGISNAVNGFISANSKARNNVLKDWKALGGRTDLIQAITNVIKALSAVLKPIKDAFHDIFPPVTGKTLADLTKRFEEFTKGLKPSKETIDGLHRTFRGLFAVLDIGKQLLGGIFGVFRRVFSAIAAGTGSFLGVTGSIGDFLVKVDEALKKGEGLSNFFNGLGDLLVAPVKMIEKLKDAIAQLFDGFSSGGGPSKASSIFGKIGTALGNMLEAFSHSDKIINSVIDGLSQLGQAVGPALQSAFQNINFEAILAVIRTGLLGGLVLMFKKFLGSGSILQQLGFEGAGGGLLANLTSPFNALTGSLKAMQAEIKSHVLMNIAIAVALLAASVVALSLVDPKKLSGALGAMTVAFGELLGAMAILGNITKTQGFIKMPIIASSLILLAGAIVVLTAAVVILAQLSWEQLLKGLGGVAVLLVVISAASVPLSANSAGLIRAGVGITAMAIGLLILSEAVKQFAKMGWGEMAQGLIGIGIGLAILVGVIKLMPTTAMIATGIGLIAISVALEILAGVVTKFGNMEWGVMGKGMLGIGAALAIIGLAMRLMPGNLLVTAAGLAIVSLALTQIAKVIQSFGGMSISEIAKGLGTLAGALIILGVALYAMSGTLAGAAALTIAAAGISVLAGALQTLGSMSWQQILTALIGLAAAFAIIGVAGALITPAIPGLLGLGAALLLIGAGIFLAGAGLSLLAAGLSALIVALPTGIGILVAALEELVKGAIEATKQFILGIVEIADALAKTAPKFVDAIVTILESVIDGLIKLMPKLEELWQVEIDAVIKIFKDNEDKIVQAGIDFLLALLKGINDNVDKLIDAGVGIITNFLNGIAEHVSDISGAALNIVIKFVEGIASHIGKIVSAGASIIVNFITGIGNNAVRIANAATNTITKFINAIANNANRIVTAGTNAIISFATGLEKNSVRLINATGQLILNFLKDLHKAIDKYMPQITEETVAIGEAIIAGMIKGLGNKAEDLYTKAREIAGKAVDIVTHPWKALSPSRLMVELGENIMLGLSIGIQNNAALFHGALEDMSSTAINQMQKSMAGISAAVDEIDANPTITPILDLTQVRNQAGELSKLATPSITAQASLANASRISPLTPEQQAAMAAGGSGVHFEQNNYSPKALTSVEIYRQTRNQLSQLKTALAVT
jgi:tape measure domain-containing protein